MFSHEKRKFMMLLLMAAREASGVFNSHKHDALDLYGEAEDPYGGNAESALGQLEDEGYIDIEDDDIIFLTRKTRSLLGLEAI